MSKILSISWYKVLPPKFGGQKGIALFTKHLAHYHEILFLCSRNNEPNENYPFKIKAELPVSKIQFFNPFCWRKIINVARRFQPSYIIAEHPYHGIAAIKAAKRTGAKLIVHSHNIESERFRNLGKWWWKILAKYEKWVHQKANLNLFKTEEDLHWAVKKFSLEETKCVVIPYGVERKRFDKKKSRELIFKKHNLEEQMKILLFAGTLDYEPNAKAVETIYKGIAPALHDHQIKILICGRNNLKEFQYLKRMTHPNVLYIGEADDIENYFAAADVFLDTVEGGGGIQTKIVEALSYDLNIVCFNEHLDKNFSLAGEKIFATPKTDHEAMIKNIDRAILQNTPTLSSFFNYYSWENITGTLNEKLNSFNA